MNQRCCVDCEYWETRNQQRNHPYQCTRKAEEYIALPNKLYKLYDKIIEFGSE